MDQTRFDGMTRPLTSLPSRRDVLRGLASAGLGLGGLRLPEAAAARKKRKSKNKKPKPNDFGCLNVGAPCRRDSRCCSSICGGKKGKRRCKAHDTGRCAAGAQPALCGGTDVACTTSLGEPGTCGTTTGNAGYCASFLECFACTTDAECQELGGGVLGPRAACIRCAECDGTGGAACATPKQLVEMNQGGIRGTRRSTAGG